MSIVERIKEKCRQKGTSMSALEKKLNYGNGNIRRWDTQKPSYDKVLDVANLLDVSIDWLLTGKEAAELSPAEQKLIEHYRCADERGKRAIERVAEAESMELESSTSQIG